MSSNDTSVSDSQGSESNSSSEDNETSVDGGTEKISEYEMQRKKRIEQNRARMEALGLNKISSSLMTASKKATGKTKVKGKRKTDDDDEEYMPATEEDRLVNSSEDDDDEFSDGENSRSRTSKVKRKYLTPKKKVHDRKLIENSDFVDDDESLMQAIALSLKHSAEIGCSKLSQSSDARLKDDLKNERKRKSCSEKDLEKRKRKKPVTSRVQMTEDELVVHFFLFDEAGKGTITCRDIQRLATAHDFTWTEKEIADMINCFVSNGDGKLNLDDFRKIVGRCNMIKTS